MIRFNFVRLRIQDVHGLICIVLLNANNYKNGQNWCNAFDGNIVKPKQGNDESKLSSKVNFDACGMNLECDRGMNFEWHEYHYDSIYLFHEVMS